MSKFKELFEEAKQSPTPKTKTKRAQSKKTIAAKPLSRSSRTTGRRSDPSYTGVFAYIPKELNEDIKERLFRRKDLDFSGLVEELLSQWLTKQT